MPSYLRDTPGRGCWNCDRGVAESSRVTLRTRSGAARTFPLCHDCAGSVTPALIALAAEAGIAIERDAVVLQFPG